MHKAPFAAPFLALLVTVPFLKTSVARSETALSSDLGRPVVIGQSYLTRSKILESDRRINVYLPEHYDDATRTFPVLFLLDGGEKEDFHHITGLAQINAAYGAGQELIVVGIEGVDRKHDLTSPSSSIADQKLLPQAGGASAYRRYLEEELKPWVQSHYRTNGHTGLIGESLAGLFTAETLLRAPASFDDYIVVSPSLWWNKGALAAEASADLQKPGFFGRRVFIAFDEPSPPASGATEYRAVQDRFAAAFAVVKPEGLSWTFTRPGYHHVDIYHPAALQAFHTLYGAH